jgi:hypothetical protein
MKKIIRVEGKLLWKWGRTSKGRYIAVCDPISQTVQAEKFEELLETIHEALDSTFRELLSTGDLHRFLRSHGWTATETAEHRSRKNVRFDVPFDLRGVRARDLEEALC